jgi:glycosyltransferase involved in cell wall biosynthesis
LWDYRTANNVDYFIANSNFIAKRIYKVYRRQAEVIYPNVAVDKFYLESDKDDYYLTASRMVPYKKIALIAETFAQLPDRRLKIVGTGPEYARIEALVKNSPNIELLGYIEDSQLHSLMQKAQAFVFAAEEDFGIIAVEAQAAGTPVIAYKRGGSGETIRGLDHEQPTGVLFEEQTIESLNQAILQFELNKSQISSANCYQNAQRFNAQRFCHEFTKFVEQKIAGFSAK